MPTPKSADGGLSCQCFLEGICWRQRSVMKWLILKANLRNWFLRKIWEELENQKMVEPIFIRVSCYDHSLRSGWAWARWKGCWWLDDDKEVLWERWSVEIHDRHRDRGLMDDWLRWESYVWWRGAGEVRLVCTLQIDDRSLKTQEICSYINTSRLWLKRTSSLLWVFKASWICYERVVNVLLKSIILYLVWQIA